MGLRTVHALAFVATLAGCGQAKIETSCTMNGLGKGTCAFTNTGTATGSECGSVLVTNLVAPAAPTSAMRSPTICSGQLAKQSTANIDFSIPDVSAGCHPQTSGLKWSDICEFTFEADKR